MDTNELDTPNLHMGNGPSWLEAIELPESFGGVALVAKVAMTLGGLALLTFLILNKGF